jgi:hypothetical protein
MDGKIGAGPVKQAAHRCSFFASRWRQAGRVMPWPGLSRRGG